MRLGKLSHSSQLIRAVTAWSKSCTVVVNRTRQIMCDAVVPNETSEPLPCENATQFCCAANLGHCWQLVLVVFCGFSEQLGAVADQLSSLQSMNENCLWIHANDEMTLFCGGQDYGWACRKLSNKSFWERWRNISLDQKTKSKCLEDWKFGPLGSACCFQETIMWKRLHRLVQQRVCFSHV